MLEGCQLSASTEWALWEAKPFEENMDTYYLGSALYNPSICFPGFSPFYSYFKKFPDNPWLQAYEIGIDLYYFLTRITVSTAANYLYSTVRSGIEHNNQMMEGPIKREHSMEELEELTKQHVIRTSPGIKFH